MAENSLQSREPDGPSEETPRNGGPVPPVHLPAPTHWPVALALGSTFVAWGLVSSVVITVAGLFLTGISLAGWIGEIRDERQH